MFHFPILSSSPVRKVCRGLFFCPLDATGAIQGLKHKKSTFFNISKIAPRPSGATSGRPKGLPGAPFGLGSRPRGALGRPNIPDRTPWAPRWGPGGGEQGLWNNKMHIYSGQGFPNKNASRASHRHFFFAKLLWLESRSFFAPSWDHEISPSIPPALNAPEPH